MTASDNQYVMAIKVDIFRAGNLPRRKKKEIILADIIVKN